MMRYLVLFLALTSVAGANSPKEVLEAIRTNGWKRVAILPHAVVRADGRKSVAGTDLATVASAELEGLRAALLANKAATGFKFVDEDSVREAVRSFSVDDLSSFENKKRLAEKTNADVLLYVTASPGPNQTWFSSVEFSDLRDNTSEATPKSTNVVILSEHAYMGHSFEARRWEKGRLEPVDFNPGMDRKEFMGIDPAWERHQIAFLREKPEHPLLGGKCPFGIGLKANGKTLEPINIDGELYYVLNPGDEIEVRMWNSMPDKGILMALYIDGVNTINKQRELPANTPFQRLWALEPGYAGALSGWYQINANQPMQTVGKFELVAPSASVAAAVGPPMTDEIPVAYGTSMNDRIGQITAVVYSSGWDGVDANQEPGPQVRAGNDLRYAFGEGASSQVGLKMVRGSKGILLGGITIHYRTSDDLPRSSGTLASNGGAGKGTAGGTTSTSQSAQGGGGQPKVIRSPIERVDGDSKLPGEDEVFPVSGNADGTKKE